MQQHRLQERVCRDVVLRQTTGSDARRSLGHHPEFVADVPKCFGTIMLGVVLHCVIMARDVEDLSDMRTSTADARTLAPTAACSGSLVEATMRAGRTYVPKSADVSSQDGTIQPVDPQTNVEYLDYLTQRLNEFIAYFDKFMTMHDENTGPFAMARGIAPAVLPREDADPEEIAAVTTELNRLAGTLMDLSQVTNVRVGVQGAGVIDPFVSWATIVQPKPLLEAPNVHGCYIP